MKMANVLSLRDTTANTPSEPRRSSERGHIEELLRLYPQTSEAETREIVRFLAKGPHLDVGLVAGNEDFAAKVAQIRKAHAGHFRIKLGEAALFILAVGGPEAFLLARYLFA